METEDASDEDAPEVSVVGDWVSDPEVVGETALVMLLITVSVWIVGETEVSV